MRKKYLLPVILLLTSLLLISCSHAADLVLVENGQSPYRIIIPSDPSGYEVQAASELQSYLKKIGGVKLPVFTDTATLSGKEILIGHNGHLDLIRCRIKFDRLGKDGFYLLTKDQYLVIAGGSEKGCLYGVYSFLETYLGCRYYTPDCQKIPRLNRISVGGINDRQVPVFTYRELYFPSEQDSSYLMWHKLDRHSGGEWGMWVHTFDDLVPPDKYFDSHPEYFSMINGKRVDDGQLCLSNPGLLNLLIENLRGKMKKRPGAKYWSVSQNDNPEACECDQCRKMNEQYGGPSGTMIHFVNEVARQFPNKIISTLAYQYTRHAPKEIRPDKNVNIINNYSS